MVAVYFADVGALRAAGGVTLGNGAGPGALFGRNTTGGAVLLVPQKPTSRFEGYVEGTYGNYDTTRIQAVTNVPVTDGLRIRVGVGVGVGVGVDHQSRDGYLHNRSGIGPNRYSDLNYTALWVQRLFSRQPVDNDQRDIVVEHRFLRFVAAEQLVGVRDAVSIG